MLKEVALKEALAAMADGEKVIMLDAGKGTVVSLVELFQPVFEKGVRFLHDTEEPKKPRSYAPGKRPGRKPGPKPPMDKVSADTSASPAEAKKDAKEDAGSDADPDPSGDKGYAVSGNMVKAATPITSVPVKKEIPKPSTAPKRPAVKKKEGGIPEKNEMVRKAIQELAMNKTQKEVALALGVSQPTISKIAITYKNEITKYKKKIYGNISGLPQSKIDYLKEHQGDPDDGTRKCSSCIYRCPTKSHGNCSYTLITSKPRGCVPWRCFQYKNSGTAEQTD